MMQLVAASSRNKRNVDVAFFHVAKVESTCGQLTGQFWFVRTCSMGTRCADFEMRASRPASSASCVGDCTLRKGKDSADTCKCEAAVVHSD